ncbi:hypothetical protein C2G38_2196343 [Gigaspora rosea]|uniref:Uncharacterized protein n=1 Tax=Gigaspora rosea TaxID=44941 RepID=A0A397UZ18_9GLOM|nr:hypothetical protein C2G38_2196343 [Gigaspora rosea]
MNSQTNTNKILTPEYLEWEAKLTELPSILSDKIRSRLYKRYKNKTGLDPWINFETSRSPQIEMKQSNEYSDNYDYSGICPACNGEHKGDVIYKFNPGNERHKIE